MILAKVEGSVVATKKNAKMTGNKFLLVRPLVIDSPTAKAWAERGEEVPSRILGAIASHPFLFGGTDRFDTVLIEETDGRLISKVGAEGVHAVSIPAERIAVAIKVEDGATRAQHPALLKLREARAITVAYIRLQREEIRVGIEHRLQLRVILGIHRLQSHRCSGKVDAEAHF